MAEPSPLDDPLWQWIVRNHRFNSLLWAEEDLARRTTVADAEIAANPRARSAKLRAGIRTAAPAWEKAA